MSEDRQTAYDFGDKAKRLQVLRSNVFEQIGLIHFMRTLSGLEAHHLRVHSLRNLLFDAVKCTAADEEDILRIHVDKLLFGMLAAALWGHVNYTAFEQFEERLLYTFTAHVARDARIIAFASNLIDFVDEHDTTFSLRKIVITFLQQTREERLHIFSHITSLRQHGGINDGKRHFEHLGDGLGEEGLARASAPNEDDIRFLNLHVSHIGGLTL